MVLYFNGVEGLMGMNLELVDQQLALLQHHGLQLTLSQIPQLLTTGALHKMTTYGKGFPELTTLAQLGIDYPPKQS
jgi:hypothetical protein